MFYTNEQHEYHASTFFNRTIDVVEKPKWVDTELLFLYLLLAAGVTTAGELPETISCQDPLNRHSPKG